MALRSRSKEAVFLVLAVITLVTAIFTFRSRPTPGPAAQATSYQLAQAGTEERQGGLGLTDPMGVMPAANGSRNPFAAPPGTPKEALVMEPLPGAEGSQPRARAQAAVTAAPPTPAPTTFPTFATATPPPQTIPLQPAGVAAPPPTNKPSLSGIVADSSGKPTAIIHEGDQRYFAKTGDTVAGKYRVQSIGNQQVVLVAARERLILKMGGS